MFFKKSGKGPTGLNNDPVDFFCYRNSKKYFNVFQLCVLYTNGSSRGIILPLATFLHARGALTTLFHMLMAGTGHNPLTLCILMDFPIHIDTICMGLPIVYFKGS